MVQFCYLRLYLCIETVSCRLLQQIAKMDMDWNFKKMAQLFQALMVWLQKITTKLLREQSLLFYRFSEGSARAHERRAAKLRDARKEGAPIFWSSHLAPSVTHVVICVSRAFCSMDQE